MTKDNLLKVTEELLGGCVKQALYLFIAACCTCLLNLAHVNNWNTWSLQTALAFNEAKMVVQARPLHETRVGLELTNHWLF